MDQEELNSKLLEAAEKGDTDRIWELVEQGADINSARDNDGRTALMLSARSGHLTQELLEALVSRGADVNASNKDGLTALMYSALWGQHLTPELLEALVSHGADINARNQWGNTALTLSAYKGYLTPELLNAFISHEADINARNKDGETALMHVAYKGYLTPELLEAFMKNGADVNTRDKAGETVLVKSAYNGHLTPELLEAFISNGADINARNKWGNTALMVSASRGHLTPELLETFISHGANLEEAYEYLKENNASAMVRSILLFFSCGYSIRDMYDGWTPENFLKWLDYNAKNLKAGARAAYVMMANMSLYSERSAVPPSTKWTGMHFVVFDEILYGRNVGAGLNMVLETFSSMNESVWLPFVPSLLGAMAGDRKKPLNVKAENAPLMVRILLHCLETEPGTALEFVKQRIGKKNLETWVNHGVEGANTLVSRLVPYLKKEENTVRDVPLDAVEIDFF